MIKRFAGGVVVVALALPVVAHAQGRMTLDTFLEKAERLERRGMLALFSSDFGLLKGEVDDAFDEYKGELAADREAGRTPHSCPPSGDSVTSDQLLEHFRSYQESRRPSITVRAAIRDMMARRYPCS